MACDNGFRGLSVIEYHSRTRGVCGVWVSVDLYDLHNEVTQMEIGEFLV